MKKYFLGEAANYSGRAIFCQLFAFGTKSDSKTLKIALGERFGLEENNVALTMNGRSALYLALKSLVTKNSKVIVNGFTCQAVIEAVRKAGCVPIYADIDENSLHYTLSTLKKAIKGQPGVKAIIVQHTLGLPVDERIYTYAKKNHLVVIEDYAHAIPDKLRGAAAALSFGKGKAIDTITGGALIMKTPVTQPSRHQPLPATFRARFYPLFGRIARALAPHYVSKLFLGTLLKLHLIERSADAPVAPERRLAHWQAKLALRQLAESAKCSPGGRKLGRSRSVSVSATALSVPTGEHLRSTTITAPRIHQLVNNRSEVLENLAKSGYFFDEIWYDVPISPKRNYKKWHFPEKDCPKAVEISQKIINLPTYYTREELKLANKIIKETAK